MKRTKLRLKKKIKKILFIVIMLIIGLIMALTWIKFLLDSILICPMLIELVLTGIVELAGYIAITSIFEYITKKDL